MFDSLIGQVQVATSRFPLTFPARVQAKLKQLAKLPLPQTWMGAALCFFPVLVNTLRGLTSVHPASIELMHSYAAPEWATREDIPAEVVEHERSIFLNSDEVRSKPEAAREKIVDGMLGKRFFAASPGGVLVDQAWIHDASKTVGQAVQESGAPVKGCKRVSVAGS